MQCLSCVFCHDRECRNRNAESDWEELALEGECPGYQGKVDAELEFAEKG